MATKMSVRDTLHFSDIGYTDQISFVFGSINGQFRPAFAKLATFHAKNNFSFAIVTGNLFAEGDAQNQDDLNALLEGKITIACPTYFTVGTTAFPTRVVEMLETNHELVPNLHFLGKRTVTRTSEGVRIVALGGVLDPAATGESKDQCLPFHTKTDAMILKGANETDILLTAMWPDEIWRGSARAEALGIDGKTALPVSTTMAELCDALKPRYHFCMSPRDFCFEREPFAGGMDSPARGIPITRFLSLASWGNPAKAKSMYAFNLNREPVLEMVPGSTLSPFNSIPPPKGPKRSAEDAGFWFTDGPTGEGDNRHRKQRRQRERSPPPGPDRCFFCLSNPNLPSHMVASVAEDSYLATAKGPLLLADTFKEQGLDFPGHMIITPLTHAPVLSSSAMPETDVRKTYQEMTRFRESLQGMVSAKSGRKLGAVTWEISRGRNVHVHWQFMPVPAKMVLEGAVESGFQVPAEKFKMGEFSIHDFGTADEVEGDYLRVWTWAEEEERVVGKSLLLRLNEYGRFDLQFPRKVMAKLLGLENRGVWQDVVQSEEEEKADVAAFRKGFENWDFTLATSA